jgi:hypothetical protein
MKMLARMFGLLLCLIPGAAGATPSPETRVGHAIICDTAVQIERFVALSNSGSEMADALKSVNNEAQNPRACGVALVMFTFGEPRAHKTMQGKSIDIVEITIHAYGDGMRWRRVPATQQYTVIPVQGIDV